MEWARWQSCTALGSRQGDGQRLIQRSRRFHLSLPLAHEPSSPVAWDVRLRFTRTPRPTVIMPTTTKHSPGQLAPDIPIAPTFDPTNPFIVQSDRSVLVEVDNPRYAEARDALAPFAELEKSPEHIHTYRISNLSLWNAAAAGFTADADGRGAPAVHQVPDPAEPAARHRRDGLPLRPREARADRREQAEARLRRQAAAGRTVAAEEAQGVPRRAARRHQLRHRAGVPRRAEAGAHRVGYPAEDLAGYTEGAPLPIAAARRWPRAGMPFHVRDYQREAADVFYAGGDVRGGCGVIVLPCGAGKTIVGIAAMALLQKNTLS